MIGWLTSLFNKKEYVKKKRRVLTEDEKRAMRTMRGQGFSLKLIASQFDVSYSTVSRITKDKI